MKSKGLASVGVDPAASWLLIHHCRISPSHDVKFRDLSLVFDMPTTQMRMLLMRDTVQSVYTACASPN